MKGRQRRELEKGEARRLSAMGWKEEERREEVRSPHPGRALLHLHLGLPSPLVREEPDIPQKKELSNPTFKTYTTSPILALVT